MVANDEKFELAVVEGGVDPQELLSQLLTVWPAMVCCLGRRSLAKLFPIPKEDWELVFQSKKGHHLLPNFNVSYAVHFWHQLNRNKYKAISDIPRDALYWDLAIDNCPKTCQKFF